MMKHKYQLNQRVRTPIGDGAIVTMPYNAEADVYGVWLDRPIMHETSSRVIPLHWKPVSEKYITAL
jgi:hypothetical protein